MILINGRYELDYEPEDHDFVVGMLHALQTTLDDRAHDRKLVRENT